MIRTAAFALSLVCEFGRTGLVLDASGALLTAYCHSSVPMGLVWLRLGLGRCDEGAVVECPAWGNWHVIFNDKCKSAIGCGASVIPNDDINDGVGAINQCCFH